MDFWEWLQQTRRFAGGYEEGRPWSRGRPGVVDTRIPLVPPSRMSSAAPGVRPTVQAGDTVSMNRAAPDTAAMRDFLTGTGIYANPAADSLFSGGQMDTINVEGERQPRLDAPSAPYGYQNPRRPSAPSGGAAPPRRPSMDTREGINAWVAAENVQMGFTDESTDGRQRQQSRSAPVVASRRDGSQVPEGFFSVAGDPYAYRFTDFNQMEAFNRGTGRVTNRFSFDDVATPFREAPEVQRARAQFLRSRVPREVQEVPLAPLGGVTREARAGQPYTSFSEADLSRSIAESYLRRYDNGMSVGY